MKRDPTFGPVVMVGAGGTTAEVLGDRAIGLAPIIAEGARRMLERLRIAPLLGAFRGREALNIDAAVALIVRMSRMIAECPNIVEADANPVLVTPDSAIVLDARISIASRPGVRFTSWIESNRLDREPESSCRISSPLSLPRTSRWGRSPQSRKRSAFRSGTAHRFALCM